ncbi:MAG: GlsB/YeaQ/YmgE family stress response membrane protein [Chloroflexi bacterium]|nr:GlsB/YeaQ/YmgE family stress response membrane protein [Chloroflexota bacterium]
MPLTPGRIAWAIVIAVLGGFLAVVMFGGDYISGINVQTIVVAFLGAIVLIAILRALPGRSAV